MRDRWLIASGGAVALLLAGVLAYVVVFPHWAAAAISGLASQQLGRTFEAGGSHLDFSPLAIRIDNPKLSGGGNSGDSFISAKSLVVPVRFGQLISREVDYSAFTLEDAEIALLIDERGEASWAFEGPGTAMPARVTLKRSSIRYFDARNGQSLSVGPVSGLLDLRADGGFAFTGAAVINSRVVRVDADLKSLARINAGGSPLDFALSTDLGTASFSGRLATGPALSLAGPVSLSGTLSTDLLRFAGLPHGKLEASVPFTIEAALDSAGRAYALRQAVLTLGQFRAVGDVTADLRGERPKLQAAFQSDDLWLDSLVPSAAAAPGEWGRQPVSFEIFNTFDAELAVLAKTLSYQGIPAGNAQLALSLKDGNLSTSGVAQPAGGGVLRFAFDATAVTLPPRVSLTLTAENVTAQPLLAGLTGLGGLTGTGSFSADLSAEGQTQEEMIGTLKGSAKLSLTDGAIANSDLAALLATVGEKILDGWPAAAGATAFKTLTGEVAVADGEASIKSLAMVTPDMDVTVTGAVDLLRRAVDIAIVAFKGTEPVLPVPVVVKGFWDKPRIYPDVQDILKDPAAGLARLKQLSLPAGN